MRSNFANFGFFALNFEVLMSIVQSKVGECMSSLPLVILAGGLGTRMREETEFRPKPMVEIGGKPMIWHIMKYYSAWGITDFVICTGYKGDFIKNYFLNYQINQSDVTVTLGKHETLDIHSKGNDNWKVSIVDTGALTPTGGRISRVEKYIKSDDFYCTYGDGLADVNIEKLTEFHFASGSTATVTAVKPVTRFGVLDLDRDGRVIGFREKPKTESWVNGGYFVLNKKIFDYLSDDTALEQEPMMKLAELGELAAFQHEGFWQPVDTVREAQSLDAKWLADEALWKIW